VTFDLSIGGTAKQLRAGSLRILQQANGRSTASFQIISEDRSYRPALGAEIIMEEDSTRIFGGLVDRVTERGLFSGSHPGILITISAVDFNAYAERRYVDDLIAEGTLKHHLQVVDDYLTTYGVTLDAGQVNGPTLPALDYTGLKRLDEVLNDFATLTAEHGEPYVWEIDDNKTLRMFQPSTQSAPFDLVGNDLPEVIGDIEVETARSPGYANRVLIKVAPKTEIERSESFTGDGSTSIFTLTYTLTKHYGYVTDDVNATPDPINKTLTTTPYQGSADWTYHPATNTLERDLGPLPNGQVASIKFDGSFTGTWVAEDAGEIASVGIWERVILVDAIPEGTTGEAFAASELAKRLGELQTTKYATWEQGIKSGQEQTVNVSARNVNKASLVAAVEIRDLVHRLERKVSTTTDNTKTNVGKGWQDVVKGWSGDKTGAGSPAPVVTDVSTGGTPGAPVSSVQYHAPGGVFAGKDSLIFEYSGNSLRLGSGSTITASSHESCFIAGPNNHITD
jgi:hypothetical protein